jgi:hypothetical protein
VAGFAFDPGACKASEHLMLWSGEQVRGPGLRAASSETENSLEGPGPLSEAKNLPEGASSPRARRKLARGGVEPSSKAEVVWSGWSGAWPSSEAEF